MFYLNLLILGLPWLLLLAGSLRRLLRENTRVRRLQAEGASLVAANVLAKLLVWSPHFGLGYESDALWPFWFARVDVGWFWIGALLFLLGFFLDRRPRPGLIPWPPVGRHVCMAFILLGSAAAAFALITEGLPWETAPFSWARIWFTLGLLPFAVGYILWNTRPEEAPNAE